MSRYHTRSNRGWRLIALPPALALGIALGGCGGGDDGDGFVPPDDVNILTSYNYTISNLQGTGTLLTVAVGDGSQAVAVDLGNTLIGSVGIGFDDNDDAFALDFTIDEGSTLSVNSDAGQPWLGTFDFSVSTDIVFAVIGLPTSGVFTVTDGTDSVTATISTLGVALSLNGGAAMSFTWDEFEDLIDDDTAASLLRRSALAFQAAEFVFAAAFEIIDAINFLVDDVLGPVQMIEFDCDTFTGSPPTGVVAQGMWSLTWLGSGQISTGDNFTWTFTDCWTDEPFDDIDDLVRGSINLNGYVEVIDSTLTLTRIGFSDGIVFDNFRVDETEEVMPDVFGIISQNSLAVTGGFVFVASAQ